MLTAAALTVLINMGGAIFNWIFKRAGRATTQVFIFILALFGAAYWQYHGLLPGLQALVVGAVALFSLAVSFYEVILRYFPAFSGPK